MGTAAHLDLDGAWEPNALGLAHCDHRDWGARLRYMAPRRVIEEFAREVGAGLPPFVLYGSGDFHFLAGMFLGRWANDGQPITLVSFDNHPDWDARPPKWSCGAWISRAMEMDNVSAAAVWGCGNFELNFPSRVFANRRALRAGRLKVFPWSERFGPAATRRFGGISRADWKQTFADWLTPLRGGRFYVTVDLDCLDAAEAITNWENGLFAAEDVAWAIREVRAAGEVIAGDLCGGWSKPEYSRWGQAIAGRWDHPKKPATDFESARRINQASLATIWPALVGQ